MLNTDPQVKEEKTRLSFSIDSILAKAEPKTDVVFSPYKDGETPLKVTCYGAESCPTMSCSCDDDEVCRHDQPFLYRDTETSPGQVSPGTDTDTKDVDSDNQTSSSSDSLKIRSKKKTRTVFSRHQVFYLEAAFDAKRYLSSAERSEIAVTLHLSETQVKVWFQNRRNKWKSQMNGEGKISPNQESGPLFFPSFIGRNFPLHTQGRSVPYPPPPFFRQPVYF